MIRAITFDVWNTLLRTKIKSSRQTILEYIIENAGQEYANTVFDRSITKKEFLKEFNKIAGTKKTNIVNKLIDDHIKTNIAEYSDIKDLFSKLKKMYKLGIISNASFVTDEILKQWPKSKFINSIIISHTYNVSKPNKKIFQIVAKQLGVKTNELLHIGDNYEKDYLANKNGIKTLLIDRNNKYPKIKDRIKSFKNLEKYLETISK